MIADGTAASPWFSGVAGRDGVEKAFLKHLRAEVSDWPDDEVVPRLTSSLYAGLPLHAIIDVPGLTEGPCTVQVGLWTGGPWAGRSGGQVLQGAWGTEYLLEDHDGNDPECLTVIGVDATPQQLATWAADWLRRQLRRPVIRQDWLRRDRPIASTWRFEDTGTVLARQGTSRRRSLGRNPDRVTQVRSGG